MLPTPTTFRPESLVGTTLDGRYRLVQHLASGGMGAIFRAEHVYMRKELALKVLRPDLSSLPDIAERFRREAEIAASLEHENIVRVTDFGRSPEGWLFLAMELLEGESLFERLRRGPLAPEEAIAILVQACRGLEAAHARGVVHRDLKPENIYIQAPTGVVKILDFGIAKLTDPQLESDTQAGMVVGTPEYLSPEQAVGGMVDARADVYAVGLIAWRLLAGRHPFKADDARGLLMMQATHPVPPLESVRPDLAAFPGLLAAIARACAKEPGDRHSTAGALGAELEAALPAGALPLPRALEAATTRLSPVPARATSPVPVFAAAAGVEETVVLQPEPARRRPGVFERAGNYARTHLLAISLGAATSLLYPGSILVARWLDERPVHRARELLAEERFEAARDLLAPAVQQRPSDARLRVLQGHALHRIDGEGAAAVDAYAAAAEIDPASLDDRALGHLANDLSRERKLADRAARVLQRIGTRAVPAVLEATQSGPGTARLRALEVARELGVDEHVDRVGAYIALLSDEDCEVRRLAARRLGDLGDPAAMPRLLEVSKQTRPIKGLFGRAQTAPACAAPEAAAAVKQLQARK